RDCIDNRFSNLSRIVANSTGICSNGHRDRQCKIFKPSFKHLASNSSHEFRQLFFITIHFPSVKFTRKDLDHSYCCRSCGSVNPPDDFCDILEGSSPSLLDFEDLDSILLTVNVYYNAFGSLNELLFCCNPLELPEPHL